jgi:ribosomal protein L7/L12
VTKMMRLAPLTVKNGIDLGEAQRYQRALEGMGAKVRIEQQDGLDETMKR